MAAHRESRRVTDLGQGTNGASRNGYRAAALTAETRRLIRLAIDHRRRELLTTPWNEDQLAALRALFADEVAAP